MSIFLPHAQRPSLPTPPLPPPPPRTSTTPCTHPPTAAPSITRCAQPLIPSSPTRHVPPPKAFSGSTFAAKSTLTSARLQHTHALLPSQQSQQGRRRGLSMSGVEDEIAFTGSRLEFQPTPDLGSSKNKMLHVVYRVGNMDRAIKFYQDVFGMEVGRCLSDLCAFVCMCCIASGWCTRRSCQCHRVTGVLCLVCLSSL